MRKYEPVTSKFFFICSLVSLLFFSVLLKAQTTEQVRIDSLLILLASLKDDTNKVKMLNDISYTYFTVNPAEGIRRGELGEVLAEKLRWQKGLAAAYSALGANYWAKNDFQQAENYYWKGLKTNEQLTDKKGMAKSLHDLAMIFEEQNNYLKALEYYQKSLTLSSELGDTFAKLGCLANIANVYEVQHKYELALSYFMRSLQLSREYGNERHIAYMTGRIGKIYNMQGAYSKALGYELSSLRTMEKFPDKLDVAAILGSIGDIYLKQLSYSKSLLYFNKSLMIAKSVPGSWAYKHTGEYLRNIGKIYLSMAIDHKAIAGSVQRVNKMLIQKAVSTLKKAIAIATTCGDIQALLPCYEALSKAQALQGNQSAALKSYLQFTRYKDSLNRVEKEIIMNRHELEYTYGKQKDSLAYQNKLQQSKLVSLTQEKKLTKLTAKQQWLMLTIILVIVSLVISFFFFRYHIQQIHLKNELVKEKTETQLKKAEHQRSINEISIAALRSQMNPHFIFNALNTIQSYVYTNDKKSAINYLSKFSELIRKILDNSSKKMITLEEETTLLQLYFEIEKARFGEQFYTAIEIDQYLDTSQLFIPPMLIQPYAENAIKHGLLHKSGEKKLVINIHRSIALHDIEIVIDDNGIGREKSMEINNNRPGHHSFANAANEKRIGLINQLSDNKTRLQIIDKKNMDGSSAGTTVIIIIPAITMSTT